MKVTTTLEFDIGNDEATQDEVKEWVKYELQLGSIDVKNPLVDRSISEIIDYNTFNIEITD